MSFQSLSRPDDPASQNQREYLWELKFRAHVTERELCQIAGVERLADLTKGEAHTLIDLLLPENRGELNRLLAELRGQLSLL